MTSFDELCKQSNLSPIVSFIGGGNMANALISGIIKSGLLKPNQILVCDRNNTKRAEFTARGLEVFDSTDKLLKAGAKGVIFLCVKPHCLQEAFGQFKEHVGEGLLVSVLAGVTLSGLHDVIGDKHIPTVRVMPNTPALVSCGASVFAVDQQCNQYHCSLMTSLLSTVGIVHQVNESQINAVCGLSGSGPAFVYTFIDAMSDAGVKAGLPRALATQLAAQTVHGASKMVLETGEHPAQLKDKVCSPGGTTIAGIAALEAGGMRSAVINAVDAAVQRAKQLGQ